MFVVSVRAGTLRAAGLLLALAVVAAAAGWEGNVVRRSDLPLSGAQASGTQASGMQASETQVSGAQASQPAARAVDASTNSGRVAFLQSFGWEVSAQPVEVAEVVIPRTWGAVYDHYNALQKQQGYDLAKYRGRRVKRWTYDVKNYPAQPGASQPGASQPGASQPGAPVQSGVRANLLVLDGRVIGGDISSVALDGFMQGFARQDPVRADVTPAQADLLEETFAAGGRVE